MPHTIRDSLATKALKRLHRFGWPARYAALITADVLAIVLAQVLAFALAHNTVRGEVLFDLLRQHQVSLPLSMIGFIGLFFAFRLYRCAWRFASLGTLRGVMVATTCGVALSALLQWVLDPSVMSPATLAIFWMLTIGLVGGMRVLLRLAGISRSHGLPTFRQFRHDQAPKRVIILGSDAGAVRIHRALLEDPLRQYRVIGFLDDEPQRHGMLIQDVLVLGPMGLLAEYVGKGKVDEVLVAAPDVRVESLKRHITAARELGVPVRMVPGVQDVLEGRTALQTEDIRIEDLLHRPPVHCDIREVGQYLDGKRVMVTGAGGSIGSELCRQVAAFHPAELVLFGHGENSIDRVYWQLVRRFPSLKRRIHMVIGSVADEARVDEIMSRHKPQVVFHAAAHKHVPIMESNIKEAVQNNAIGSYNLSVAAGRHGAERFVMVSTDKAVYPSSIMGATKWLAEEAVRHVACLYPETIYLTTRFGNVLGSRGSVVNIFREQIARGGPVTVTDPGMTRYFMTIPEAVQLVLQSGATGQSGDLFLLEMGEPMRIIDLAHDMIRLAGYVPNRDIDVLFTGLRPGEKLHESLAMDDERVAPTGRPGLTLVTRPQRFGDGAFEPCLLRLRELQADPDPAATLRYLAEVVPSQNGQPGLGAGLQAPRAKMPWVRPVLRACGRVGAVAAGLPHSTASEGDS
jgi:FlaA1/EpsC-like NDP-sugar epimerase